jgi:prevent-host-death family protein
MQKTIGMADLQRDLRTIFEEVVDEGVEYVLTRRDRPEAVLIPYRDFAAFLEWREREVGQEFDRAIARLAEQNAQYDETEIASDVEAALQEARTLRAK